MQEGGKSPKDGTNIQKKKKKEFRGKCFRKKGGEDLYEYVLGRGGQLLRRRK